MWRKCLYLYLVRNHYGVQLHFKLLSNAQFTCWANKSLVWYMVFRQGLLPFHWKLTPLSSKICFPSPIAFQLVILGKKTLATFSLANKEGFQMFTSIILKSCVISFCTLCYLVLNVKFPPSHHWHSHIWNRWFRANIFSIFTFLARNHSDKT